jgi:hypothetical protein
MRVIYTSTAEKSRAAITGSFVSPTWRILPFARNEKVFLKEISLNFGPVEEEAFLPAHPTKGIRILTCAIF